MAKDKKVKEVNPRPEKYKKSDLKIDGTVNEAIGVFFKKPKDKPKDGGGTVVGGG